LEEERRERERNQSLPISLINAFKLVLGSRESSSRHQLYDVPRSLPSAASLGLGSEHQHQHLQRPQVNGAGAYSMPSSSSPTTAVPPNYAPLYYNPEQAWYNKGALFYIFFPINAASSAAKFAGNKLSGVQSDAAEFAYHQSSIQNGNQSHHGHSRRIDKH